MSDDGTRRDGGAGAAGEADEAPDRSTGEAGGRQATQLFGVDLGSIFLLLLVLGTGVAFFYMVRDFFVPVLLAAVFTTLFYPAYELILGWVRGRRTVASILTCVLLLLLILGPVYAVIDQVARQGADFFSDIDRKVERLLQEADEFRERIAAFPLPDFLPAFDFAQFDWQKALRDSAGGLGSALATVVNKTSRGTVQVLVTAFVTLFTMFYFFIDGPRMVERLRFLVPLQAEYEEAVIRRFVSVARATVKGTLVIALVQGALGALTLWIFGVEGWVLWGLVMVVLSVIPVIGAWLVMYPAAAVQLILGHPWAALGIFLVTVVVILNVDNLLRPRLVGRDAGLHDLLIFFSTLGGIITFGAMGFIIGPVIAAFFLSVLDIYAQEFKSDLSGPGTPAS